MSAFGEFTCQLPRLLLELVEPADYCYLFGRCHRFCNSSYCDLLLQHCWHCLHLIEAGRQAGLYLVMPSGGHKKDNLALVEDWSDDSDVRKVAASSLLGVITNQHITLLHPLFLAGALGVIPQLHG